MPRSDKLPQPKPRKRLSRRDFAQLMLDQDGRCRTCGEKLKAEAIIDEHLVPLDFCGSNDLSNRALLCLGCAREKTRQDLRTSAKGRRLRGETGQLARRRKRRIQEKTTVPNQTAPRRLKRKVNGEVVVRRRKRRRLDRILFRPD